MRIYRESKDSIGLNDSLTMSVCNGTETFVSQSCFGTADPNDHSQGQGGQEGQRGHGCRGGRADQAVKHAKCPSTFAAGNTAAESPCSAVSIVNAAIAAPSADTNAEPETCAATSSISSA